MTKQPIDNIKKDAKPLDLILIELPSTVQMCGSFSGSDYVAGFFYGVNNRNLLLSRTQKDAYAHEEPTSYPLADISSYEILRRYKPVPGDGIDLVLSDALGINR